jgi:hypothetical protein
MFGISAENDPLLVEDVRLVTQSADVVNVAFHDEAVAEFFEASVDEELRPERFARIWIHTHPGDSAEPSFTDEATFERVFGHCDWAVMAILARGGERYARLRFAAGPGGQLRIPMQVDWEAPFPASDHAAWRAEYERSVHPLEQHPLARMRRTAASPPTSDDSFEVEFPLDEYGELLDQFSFDPAGEEETRR